jgi:hypothetical protein
MSWREDREKLRAEYGALFEELAAILFRHDPEGINFETNTDEYESEVGTILPRLKACSSAVEVQRVVHEEFQRWFSPGATRPFEAFAGPAEEIWQAWSRDRGRSGAA